MSCHAQLHACHRTTIEHVNFNRPFNISRPRHSSATHPRGSNSRCIAAAVVSSSTSSPRARQLACRTAAVLQPYQLAAIAAEPVVKVALLSGGGALCAKQGILTLEGRRMLSVLIMNVFTPALVGGWGAYRSDNAVNTACRVAAP